MAAIGMRYPVYAPITTYTEGSAITYGNGAQVCHAIAATVTPNRRDNPLYGNDTKIENDKGLTDYTIAFEGDKVPLAMRAALLGETAVSNTATPPVVTHYEVTDVNPPYVGFGYMRVLMENNVTKYESFWFHRVQFAIDSEESNTKKENIDWGTFRLTGTGFGVWLDSSGIVKFYDHMEFDTESAAKNWLKSRAGIT